IAGMHGGALAVDGSVGSFAFDDEAKRGSYVTMSVGGFAGHYQLQTGIETPRDAGHPAQTGIFEHQHAALGFFGCNAAAGFHEQWAHFLVAPDCWSATRVRLHSDQFGERLPQRRGVFLFETSVELLTFFRGLGFNVKGRHSVAPQNARTFTSIVPIFS